MSPACWRGSFVFVAVGASAQRRVQLADQFADAASAPRGVGVAPQDVHHDGVREELRLRDVVGTDGGVAPGGELERTRGMSGGTEDVLDLSRFRQRVEEHGAGRGERSTRRVARRSLSCIAGFLGRPVHCPCAVAYRLEALAAVRKSLCRVDRGSGAPVVGTLAFEDHQGRPGARHGVPGHLPEFGRAELDRRGVIRHGAILARRNSSGNQERIFVPEGGSSDGVGDGDLEKAKNLQRQLVQIVTVCRWGALPAGWKVALELEGVCGAGSGAAGWALAAPLRPELVAELRRAEVWPRGVVFAAQGPRADRAGAGT